MVDVLKIPVSSESIQNILWISLLSKNVIPITLSEMAKCKLQKFLNEKFARKYNSKIEQIGTCNALFKYNTQPQQKKKTRWKCTKEIYGSYGKVDINEANVML